MLNASVRRYSPRPFVHDRSGVAAVEFALILPVMLVMLVGGLELSAMVTASNRATFIAETIGELVTRSKAPIGERDMSGIIKMAALIDPNVIRFADATGKELDKAVDITVSSVVFEAKPAGCRKECTYEANVVFSEALSGTKRACGKLQSGENRSATTIPKGTFGPGSVVVVDVVSHYQPIFATILKDTFDFQRSTYFRPRQVAVVNYVKNCPGYPVQ